MLKKNTFIFGMMLAAHSLIGQRLSFPELKKIKALKPAERAAFLTAKQYGEGIENTEADNSAVTYHSSEIRNDTTVTRSVIVTTSKGLHLTILEYSTTDEKECDTLLQWLNAHGYKQNKSLSNKSMIFFQSRIDMVRFFEESYRLSNGSEVKRGTFVIEG
jgi:hypothetical protein